MDINTLYNNGQKKTINLYSQQQRQNILSNYNMEQKRRQQQISLKQQQQNWLHQNMRMPDSNLSSKTPSVGWGVM